MPPKPKSKVPTARSNVATGRGRGVKQNNTATAAGIKKTPTKGPPPSTSNKSKEAFTDKKQLQQKKPTWSSEDVMARKIQTVFRAYRCRKLLNELRLKKKEYDDTIDKLQREAFVQLVKMEQQRAAQESRKREEELRKRREESNRIKRFLDAAFDGDCNEINKLLGEVKKNNSEMSEAMLKRLEYKLVECSDPNKNTPLSEAGAGGHPDTIKLLLYLGANPNSKGQYGRTPLYRAAFAGHIEAARVLLESGADPRLYADDGATPEQVSSRDEIKQMLNDWNIEDTEQLLLKLEDTIKQRKAKDDELWKSQENQLQSEIDDALKENSAKQLQLSKAHEELNKRIYEHDECVPSKQHLTIPAIHDAEDWLEKCKLEAQTAKERLQQAKLKLRLKRKEFHSDVDQVDDENEVSVDAVIVIKEMDDVLMKDVGNKIADSNKWPLIIDPSKQSATFLKYRDTNYLSAVNPKHMEPETIRMSLLGALRFGKFAVLDLLDIEGMWPSMVRKFDAVQKDLLPALISKDFLKEERYLKLIRRTDGDQYSPMQFLSARIHNFKFVILTQLFTPPPELVGNTYIIRIHVPEPTVFS